MAFDTTIRPDDNEHDRAYKQAIRLVDAELPLHGVNRHAPGFFARRRLRKGLRLLERVIEINPGNWAAMWVAAMVLRRLGDLESALDWFKRSDQLHPENADLAREASITAMELGRHEEAIHLATCAVASRPDDPGLVANLALAHLFSQNPSEAKRLAEEALSSDPSDVITRRILGLADDVLARRRPCPRHSREV